MVLYEWEALIKRPEGLESIEVDLVHINKNGRSFLTKEYTSSIVMNLLNGLFLQASDTKEFKKEICVYFLRTGFFKSKKFKLVFCICSDKPKTIGIITLFRIRG